MNENADIEELLNGYIDAELTARRQNEVQRLISHDTQVERRLRELQNCKMLVSSLPCAEAPAEMIEDIKASLERRTLLSEQPSVSRREGARHLLARKVIASAALLGLVAVLTAVIYTIVGPWDITKQPLVTKQQQTPAGKVEAEKTRPGVMAAVEKPVAKTTLPAMEFNGRLELKTSAFVAVNAFINRTIEDSGLSGTISPEAEGNKTIYTLSCGRESMQLLLADLGNIWSRLNSAALFVQTDRIGEPVVVGSVDAEQIAGIVNQDSFEGRIKAAQEVAAINDITRQAPGKELFAVIDGRTNDLITIPKPVLTSNEKKVKKSASMPETGEKMHLTIVVTAGQ